MSHTKGPWEAGDSRIWSATQEIAEVKRVATNGDYSAIVLATKEQEDNARLIAAAPELLEACSAIRRCDFLACFSASLQEEDAGEGGEPIERPLRDAINKCLAAIAKAT